MFVSWKEELKQVSIFRLQKAQTSMILHADIGGASNIDYLSNVSELFIFIFNDICLTNYKIFVQIVYKFEQIKILF